MPKQKVIFKLRTVKNRKSGKVSYTWSQVHTNGNVVNHKYNRSIIRDIAMRVFIEKIKKGEYEIVSS